MENQDIDVISDTIATGIQPEHIEAVEGLNIGVNENPNDNRVVFGCVTENCGFVTTDCNTEEVAYKLLALHVDVSHKEQQKNEKLRNANKIWIPEPLDLDPSEDNGEEFLFWLARFRAYLHECGIDKATEKY